MREYLYKIITGKVKGLIPTIIKVFLSLLSVIYGIVVKVLIFAQRLRVISLNCKTISVGNITVGGTGKTSLVEYIAKYLKQEGRKLAIISRGYKRKTIRFRRRRIRLRRNPLSALRYEEMGDEPYMLSKKLSGIPIIVDADRIRAAKKAVKEYGCDTVILDDGFQQWRIKKDLEIVTIDATNPFGNRRLLPAGILREPLSSLKRADVFILTKANLKAEESLRNNRRAGLNLPYGELPESELLQPIRNFLKNINPSADIFTAAHQPIGFYNVTEEDKLLGLDIVKGANVALVSGIGDPDSFENLVLSLGAKIVKSFRFPDHYTYKKEDIDKITKESQDKGASFVITTEKDISRFYPLPLTTHYPLLFLRIELKITQDEQVFHNRLLRIYSA